MMESKKSINSIGWRLLLLLSLITPGLVQAVPAIRFITQPPASPSSASRFSLAVELYETTTNARLFTTGVPITLGLFRCPGHPSACSVTIVNSNLTSGSTTLGARTFSNLFIEDAADDYYFAASAVGYNTGTSSVIDVNQATLRFQSSPSSDVSTASRFPLQVSIRNGAGGDAPVDALADNIALRVALYACVGFPSSCSVNVLSSNYANAVAQNGVATFNNVFVGTVGEDRYFAASAPSNPEITGTLTSNVVNVNQATLRFQGTLPSALSVASRPLIQLSIRNGSGPSAPVDSLADNIPLRLGLYACPGFPSACTPTALDANHADAVAQNGLATFSNVSPGAAGDDRYFTGFAPSNAEVPGLTTTSVFDVDAASLQISAFPAAVVSTASRIPVRVEVRRGSGSSAPLDTTANGLTVRLARYACPGFPSSCSVNVINGNLANAVTQNGIASFNNITIPDVATDNYFAATVPADGTVSQDTSQVFDVEQATLRVESPLSTLYAGLKFALDAVIRAGTSTGAPIDVMASNLSVRLELYTCPGFPMACSVSPLNTNFANASTVDGIASFNDLLIPTQGEDRYFYPVVIGTSGVDSDTSDVFDVIGAPPRIFMDGMESP